jgi:hypothetical protein
LKALNRTSPNNLFVPNHLVLFPPPIPHPDWFQQHHIFNPSDCTPGLLC